MEAILYDKLENQRVKCNLCNHRCLIENGKRGICKVRENQEGELIALNFGKSIAVSIDPIEKKPIFEFLPRTITYSFATQGCNLHCPWCQNHTISQVNIKKEISGYEIEPKKHVEIALENKCPSISYTYSEPTIFIEYALETMKIAKEAGLKNIWVSNGYFTHEALDLILPFVDAFNIDYKGTNQLYHQYCGGSNWEILNNLKRIRRHNIHLEVTTLIIPKLNDSSEEIEQIADELISALGKNFIWHLTRFHPQYKMKDVPITSHDTMYKALKIARDKGIRSVYLGNI